MTKFVVCIESINYANPGNWFIFDKAITFKGDGGKLRRQISELIK
ncbi:hypothetical protein [Umezakia ovalisporum]|uniref:Uncharacterized protein n=1 Tax=Umezakia ovalisporum FSS-43 TaxID=2740520 RepID=A0ABT6K057_9CYAN|nr:hypothetical protein [Umezakia ovalisporum]MDH6055495.1 hypothetical protein [Umezakia ovalisporum FSS-43]MDH6068041.1 hypothetical protein [Umezakia ovalisporum APH033B]MDH6070499.1 hypothetical protein [Umezakia ovalisporum CobakiLakeA]MDH6077788.1 hypothetical protein [Umezakia ovalisporum FSS-45]MDH6083175.1 hypothetical protein [Umezakia ovalisporum FSS-44]